MGLLNTVLTPLGRMLRNRRADESLSIRHAPQLKAPRTIELSSPAFAAGGTIPDKHCSMDLGPNISPELDWTGVPAGTAQLLLVIEDIDAPKATPGLHTIALLPATTDRVKEGALAKDNPGIRYVPALRGRFGLGYTGPRPLPGHGLHRYGFHLYALDTAIPADHALTGLPDVLAAAEGHVLADGFLEGVKVG